MFTTLAVTEVVSYLRFKRKLKKLGGVKSTDNDNNAILLENKCSTGIVLRSNRSNDDAVLRTALEDILPQCDVQFDHVIEEDEEEKENESSALEIARSFAAKALDTAKARGNKLQIGVGMYTSTVREGGLTLSWVVINKEGKESLACSCTGTSKGQEDPAVTVKRAWTQLALF